MKKKLFLGCVDVTLIIFSYITAFVLRLNFDGALSIIPAFTKSLPIFVVTTPIIFLRGGMYNAIWKYASIDSVITTVKAVTSSVLLSVFFLFFLQLGTIPRSIFIIYWLIFLFSAGGVRFSIRIYYNYSLKNKNKNGKRILIYGAGSAGTMIVREMKSNPTHPFIPICFVDDDSNKIGNKIYNLPIYAGKLNLNNVVRENNIKEVLIAIPSSSGSNIRDIVERCNKSGVKFKILPELSDYVDGKVSVSQIREIGLDDLLKRAPKDIDKKQIANFIKGKSVLITGAGGSIGSELARQVAKCNPAIEKLVENNEYALYKIDSELKEYKSVELHSILESIVEPKKLEDHLKRFKTDIIFHSAAYKHVPLVELNPCEAIINNIQGTINVAKLAEKHYVKKFVLISSDKAVRPTSIMGATKRVCELYMQHFNSKSLTEFVAVRFGNVLDSSGSVVPKFKEQILKGGPLTVTHPEITRYFMLIPEAVQLVLQVGSIGKGGEIFILDMGNPVKILDMAKDMIKMMGLVPEKDIKVEFTGLRPGEKLYEELLTKGSEKSTLYESITIASETNGSSKQFHDNLERLLYFSQERNINGAIHYLKKIVPEFTPQNKLYKEILKKPFLTKPKISITLPTSQQMIYNKFNREKIAKEVSV